MDREAAVHTIDDAARRNGAYCDSRSPAARGGTVRRKHLDGLILNPLDVGQYGVRMVLLAPVECEA
jgi:hypothetical protein